MHRPLCLGLLAACLWIGTAHAVSDPAELLPDPAQEARAEAIGSQLRCLVCQNESIEASDAGLARDIRTIIRQQVVAGRTDREIVAFMVARYGAFILLRPPFEPLTWLLWASPVMALLAGGIMAVFALRRQKRRAAPVPLSMAERARLDRLLRP